MSRLLAVPVPLLVPLLVPVLLLPVAGCSRPPDDARGGRPPTAAATSTEGPAPRGAGGDRAALRVLRDWDERRSAAFAARDAGALRALYPPRSPLARRDETVLRAYQRRGVRLTGVRHQVVSAAVLESTPHRVRLVVTERVVATAVLDGAEERQLPRPGYERRVLRFERRPAGWLLSSVSGA